MVVTGRTRSSAGRKRHHAEQHAGECDQIARQGDAPESRRIPQHRPQPAKQRGSTDRFHKRSGNNHRLVKASDFDTTVLYRPEHEERRVQGHQQPEYKSHVHSAPYNITLPPATSSTTPVIQDEASELKNSAAAATSSGCPRRGTAYNAARPRC